MELEKIKKRLPEGDYVRKEIRRYIKEHPDENLSISPDRGIPSERHKKLINKVSFDIIDAHHLFHSTQEYDINNISATINEEYWRVHKKQ